MSDRLLSNPLVRVRPHLYLSNPGLIITDLVTNKSFRLRRIDLLLLLADLAEPQPRETVVSTLAGRYGVDQPEATLSSLRSRNLVVAEGSRQERLAAVRRRWTADGWAAAFDYLVAIRGMLEDQGESAGDSADDEYVRGLQTGCLSLYETHEDAETVALPDPDDTVVDTTLQAALTGEPSEQSRSHLSFSALSLLCHLTFGQTGEVWFDDLGPHEGLGPMVKKTSPSGGSWHPTEAYLVPLADTPLGRDLYHYSVREHELERLSTLPGRRSPTVAELSKGFPAVGQSTELLVVYASRVERNMMKYKDSRVYKTIQQDLGHLAETLRLVARSLGFRAETRCTLNPGVTTELLNMTPLEQPTIGYSVIE